MFAPAFMDERPRLLASLAAMLASPVVIIFLSSNFVNAGNLAYNIVFSRLLGPELFGDLATVLTIKLALLGVLGAIQMAVSQRVAGLQGAEGTAAEQALSRINRICFVALWIALPLTGVATWAGSVDARLGLSSPWMLFIVLGSLPFTAPLSILRGVVLGRVDVKGIVLSANIEMAVRLVGGMLAWQAGLGVEGVVAAIALSIVAGWFIIRDTLPAPKTALKGNISFSRAIFVAALPFAVLQAAQVLMLDGDVVTAKLLLSDTEAGYVAALVLFQRIQFFACFGLAAVLLPSVASAVVSGDSVLRSAAPVLFIFAAIAAPFVAGVILMPELLITAMVGGAFAAAAPYLWMAGIAAVACTLSYLLATFLAGLGDRSGIWIFAAAAPVQIVATFHLYNAGTFGPEQMLGAKLACQLGLAAVLAGFTVWRMLRRTSYQPVPSGI